MLANNDGQKESIFFSWTETESLSREDYSRENLPTLMKQFLWRGNRVQQFRKFDLRRSQSW